ncbi:hypothetical protein D3C87_144320 [compost metagenome]
MTAIQCKLEIPNVDGLKENELTVGREFLLACEGEFPRDLKQEDLHFVLKPELKYLIKLRSFEFRSATSADIKVVGYTAGRIRLDDLQLSDGVQTLNLGRIEFPVETVIEPPQPTQNGEQPQKPEPFGPLGPMHIGIPTLYWVILAAVIGLLVALIGSKIYRVLQRRRIVEGLKQHDSAQSPISEFYASLRQLQRNNQVFFGGEAEEKDVHECIVELHHMLLLYVTRKYKIPALEWSPRLVAKDLRKYHPKFYFEFGDELQKLMKEFYKAKQAKSHSKTNDAINLSKRARKLVEGMERFS